MPRNQRRDAAMLTQKARSFGQLCFVRMSALGRNGVATTPQVPGAERQAGVAVIPWPWQARRAKSSTAGASTVANQVSIAS